MSFVQYKHVMMTATFEAANTVDDPSWVMWNSAADLNQTINSSTSTPIDLEQLLGPRRFELYKVVPITVIYAVIFVTGVVGNVSTAVVIFCNKYMHNATNYYLCNLVLSDLLVLALGLPVETYLFWSAYCASLSRWNFILELWTFLVGVPVDIRRDVLRAENHGGRDVDERVDPHHHGVHRRTLRGHLSPDASQDHVESVSSRQDDHRGLDRCQLLLNTHLDPVRRRLRGGLRRTSDR